MLKVFRHKTVAKAVLWGILILILPAFVLWGTGSIGGRKDKGPRFAGYIDGRKISFDDYAASLRAVRCQIITNYFNQPAVLDIFMNNKILIGKVAWDRLIMVKEAKKRGLKASDAEVVTYIRSHPVFSRSGAFDPKIYDYVLRHNIGLDPRSFEEVVRSNLIIQKMNDMLTRDITITDDEIRDNYRKDNAKFTVSLVMFSPDSYLDKVAVDETVMKDFYEKHKGEFSLPPKEGEEPPATPAVASYDDVKDRIRAALAQDQARAIAAKAAEDGYRAIKEIMEKEKLDFEAAAAKAGFKTGRTQPFSRGEYLDGIGEALPVAEAAAKLKKDDVGGPLQTRKGVIVLRVVDVQEFDEVKFKADKEAYSKTALEAKKTRFLEDWLRGLEKQTTVNIDFGNYEKYYR